MTRRLVVRLGMLALAWGCSRGPSREPARADTVSLAPLADSSASVELRGTNAPTRTDSQPARVANRTRAPSRRLRPVSPARPPSRIQPTTRGYQGAAGSSDSDRVIAESRSAPRPVDSAPAASATQPDTGSDTLAAVGDSIVPAATPVTPAGGSEPTPPRAASPAASPVAEPSRATGTADSTGIARPPANALPPGTQIRAILQDSISSLRNTVGQTVTATVSGDMRAPDGLAVLPSGSVVHLTVDRLSPARSRSAKDGELALRADSVSAEGHSYRVDASVQPVPHELKGRGVTAGEAEKVGAGAAAGAVVGAVATGKTKGAVIGGAVGAVGGAVVAAQTASRDVIVAPRTLITLILKAPITRAE